MQIFKEAVEEILGGKDGICAWIGNTLKYKAERINKWQKRDETCPDFKEWSAVNGYEDYNEAYELDEFAKWVSLGSGLIDGQQRELYGTLVSYSLEGTVKYQFRKQLDFKQTQDSRFSDSLFREHREDSQLVWSFVKSADQTDIWPDGSFDTVKEKLKERRTEVAVKHKESKYKEERLLKLDLAIGQL
jgi:hypothetical protein